MIYHILIYYMYLYQWFTIIIFPLRASLDDHFSCVPRISTLPPVSPGSKKGAILIIDSVYVRCISFDIDE